MIELTTSPRTFVRSGTASLLPLTGASQSLSPTDLTQDLELPKTRSDEKLKGLVHFRKRWNEDNTSITSPGQEDSI